MRLDYYWAKLAKKARGSALLDAQLHPTAKVEAGSFIAYSSFDRHSYCGYDCSIFWTKVGSFCSIAGGVSIGGELHPMHFVSTSPVFLSHEDSVKSKFARHRYPGARSTTIGNDVWIGERAMLKGGITVGHGAVIGMGSVVTKDVAPYAIVGGNPARVIRMRFDEDVVAALLASKWWDFPDDKLRRAAEHFDDVNRFLKELASL